MSDGKGEFTIEPLPDADARRARSSLHLREGEDEYLDPARLRQIVKHLFRPYRPADRARGRRQGERRSTPPRRCGPGRRAEITDEQYKEFYHHVGHSFDDPWLTLHNKAEGVLEYTSLLFVPSQKPFDLFEPERKSRVKLYVRRVFITDEGTELLPAYLRFLRGVVDSEDLPLNISREMLQSNPMVGADPPAADPPGADRARQEGHRRARGIRQILGQFRRGAEGRALRGPRAARRAARPRPLPLDRARRARLARRLCRGDAAGAGGDLHDHRRQSRLWPNAARSSKAFARAASRYCC